MPRYHIRTRVNTMNPVAAARANEQCSSNSFLLVYPQTRLAARKGRQSLEVVTAQFLKSTFVFVFQGALGQYGLLSPRLKKEQIELKNNPLMSPIVASVLKSLGVQERVILQLQPDLVLSVIKLQPGNNIDQQFMVKAYFNYSFEKPVGQLISPNCNIVASQTHVFCGVNQYIAVVNIRTREVERYLYKPNKHVSVRCLTIDSEKGRLFSGYEDGEILVWDYVKGEILMELDIHQSTVSDIKIEGEMMVSAGFDTKIIVWDLISQECEVIDNAHKGAVLKIEIIEVRNPITTLKQQYIISLGRDSYLKLHRIGSNNLVDLITTITEAETFFYNSNNRVVYVPTSRDEILVIQVNEHQDEQTLATRYFSLAGKLNRNTFAKVKCIAMESHQLYMSNNDKAIEIYQILNEKELKSRKKTLLNRQKEKKSKEGEKGEDEEGTEVTLDKSDEEVRVKYIKTKVIPDKCQDFIVANGQLLINTGKNIYNFSTEEYLIPNTMGVTTGLSMSHPYICQLSHSQAKIYQSGNFNALFTLPVEVLHCTLYKSYAIILSNKEIIIWNLASNQEIIRKEEPLGKRVYASNDGILVYGDNTLHFYSLGRDKRGNIHLNLGGEKFFSQKLVQCSYLNDTKYIVCTEDRTIQVLYSDSHKVFLSLYGHSLPIRSYDTSTDCNLLVSGSADKDIKLWNLDFGDVKKSIFAHSESVTVVKFCKDTHYFFSGGQDGHLKYWDGDTGQLILDLEQSTQMIRDIAISTAGDYVVAAGNDTGFRVWRQTSDQIFESEEKEKRMQKIMVQDYTNTKLKQNKEKTTYDDLKHGEQIIECLQGHDKPLSLLRLLQKIPPTKLKSSLSFLHSKHRATIHKYLQFFVDCNYNLQLVYRVCDALNIKDKGISNKLRAAWELDNNLIKTNTAAISILLQTIQDNKALTNFR